MMPPMIVLAGGFGTRLRSVVSDVPKPMAPIGGRPFLEVLLEYWIAQGQRDFIFSLYYQHSLIQKFLEERQETLLRDVSVRVAVEPKPLGTGGAVKFAAQNFKLECRDVIVSNADTWLGGDCIREMSASRSPSMAILKVEDSSRYGSVEVDSEYIVQRFREKEKSAGVQSQNYINGGLYKVPLSVFYEHPNSVFSIESEILPGLVRAGSLRGIPIAADFFDIGVPVDYANFCRWYATFGK